MTATNADKRTGSRAIDRAVEILNAFRDFSGDVSLSDLAKHTGLPLSTAHRIVEALGRGRLIAQDPESEKYHLGGGLPVLGQIAMQRLGLRDANQLLADLAAQTGESVMLLVKRSGRLSMVSSSESTQVLRVQRASGGQTPMHATAAGKLFLGAEAHPEEAIAELGELARFTDATITSAAKLLEVSEDSIARGFALNNEELNIGVRSLAVPLREPGGDRVVAVLSLEAPVTRLGEARIEELLPVMIEAAANIAAATSFDLI